ncbi:MAG TPA: helix-hairpin-helix domain-containing protein [Thermoanaerobaculia bacterium]|nr:helix-hairpin-helix domain-containing protein [Thermoanaerobaculia bacterium]
MSAHPRLAVNEQVAAHLEEIGRLLLARGANRFRVGAWARAARNVRGIDRSVAEILSIEGLDGLDRLPGIGRAISRAIRDLVVTGRFAMLDRLRADTDPEALLATVPGIGPRFARTLDRDFGIHTLEDLEAAAHDGRLARIRGMGDKRVSGVRDSLAARLGRVQVPSPAAAGEPPVADLLDVDREYRRGAAAGSIPRIAPRRFNPRHERWLPVLHTARGGRHYTALFSNTARAHDLGRTRDWVVIYSDTGDGDRTWTVVDAPDGRRVVRGRENESAAPPSTAANRSER